MSEMLEYKCPCCGGAIGFDSSIQKMKCPYCDTEFDIETLRAYDDVLKDDVTDDMSWEVKPGAQWDDDEAEGLRSYACKSCGGEIIAEDTTAATSCPFCGNPVVMTEQLSGVLKPDYIIPFKLSKEDAKAGLVKHLHGKRLLPDIFKDQNHIDEIKGIYVPFWLFDADADASIRYRATKIRRWSDSNYNYVETSYFSVIRDGKVCFAGIPVDGSAKMEDALMESIEPYQKEDMVDFQTAYLAGYLADKYDVTADESIARANERVKHSTESLFASTVKGYDTVAMENSSIRLSNGKARYALYPVWLLNTTWRDKSYTFAMNGQTGKFIGDLPVDRSKYWRWWGLLAGIFSIVSFGLSYLLI